MDAAPTVEPAPENTPKRAPVQDAPAVENTAQAAAIQAAMEGPRDPDTVYPGDRNDQVALLQYRLDQQGYRGIDGQPLPQDGRYDQDTVYAVAKFQQAHDLPATGIADQKTQYEVAYAQPVPERTITPVTQEERDAREQAQREANRQGLSPDDAKHAVDAATVGTPAPVMTLGAAAPRTAATDTEDTPPRERAPETPAAQEVPLAAMTVAAMAWDAREDAAARLERERADAVAETRAATEDRQSAPTALAHHAATRDESDDQRKSPADPDRTQPATPEPAPPAPSLMTHPGHPAHAIYTQALSQIERGDVVPTGTMTQEDKSKLAAGVVAQFLAEDNRATRIDGLYASKHNIPGMPGALIPVQGDPTTDYCRRASIDVTQALQTPLEQSSQTAQKAIQELAQELAKEQALKERQVTEGPVMRIGPRTLTQGPQDDGGSGDRSGGGDGGGG